MMKRSVVPLALALFLLFSNNCFGNAANLRYKISYEVAVGGFRPITVVGVAGAGKGFDGEDMWSTMPTSAILLGIRRVNGVDDWNGADGWYTGDERETLAPGQSVTVDGIYLWAVPGTPSRNIHLRLVYAPFFDPLEGGSYSLSLVSIPQGIQYTGPTTWGPASGDIILPFYSTDNGETGYRFRMNVFAIPEPSSLLALGAGLLPLAVGVRRRCRRTRRIESL